MQHDIVERAKRGDHAAYASLIRGVGKRLHGIALRVTRDGAMADDAVQETLIQAWRDLPSLRDVHRFDAWITQIVIRRCYRELKRNRAPGAELRPEHSDDHAARLADQDELERGLSRLTPEQRSVLVLRYYAGLEPTEMAEVLGLPAGTVRSRIHYATSALRSALDADARRVANGQGLRR
jgi:RNA polymerase sigma-70 factor, ECF subfamily